MSDRFKWSRLGLAFLALTLVNASAFADEGASEGRREAPTVEVLRTEYQKNPIGIDIEVPRFSWQIRSDERDFMQSAWQIHVADSAADLQNGENLVWDSGKVASNESVFVEYKGPGLSFAEDYFWRVRIWGPDKPPSGWSATASFELGLAAPSAWNAQWIEADLMDDPSRAGPAPILRNEFTLSGDVARARVYVTSHGLYELHINGTRVGDQLFTPGWTAYNERLQYQTYDVTGLLRRGANAVGAVLGNGWYRGELGWEDGRNYYGKRLALLMQIRVTYEDGREEEFVTDSAWKSATGPILMSEIYDGEVYDARLEKQGWTSPGFDDREWAGVSVVDAAKDVLVAPLGPPVRRIEEIEPVEIVTSPDDRVIVDMGQNMVGWVRLEVQGPAGTRIILKHAEVLDESGDLYTENLRNAEQRVEYILKGDGVEVFEPHFTFQGFRYVSVDGFPGEVTSRSLTGIVIHSDMERTIEFETSNSLVNQLQQNILWSQKGNFLDVPTDCPQRDERMGWTGDAQVFSSTAAFNMDVSGFFGKWLQDLASDQYDNGAVPYTVPDAVPGGSAAAGWADAATIIPWQMYLAYGDRRVLERQYQSMVKWVDFQKERAGDDYIWSGGFHFGDWLDFFSVAKGTRFGATSTDLIATAYFAHSANLLSRAAGVLERQEDAAGYQVLFERIKSAFVARFVSGDGRVGDGTQTAYVIALDFDLLPESMRTRSAARLAMDVRERGHLTTGFLGTPRLLHILSRYGYLDEAYSLLLRDEFPSWLYPVKRGATTIWERWDGVKADGSFQDAAMNSFNHYAYGAVGDWMYRVMAGIDTDASQPGYRHIMIQPRPGGGLTHVRAEHASPYGPVSSEWMIDGETFVLRVGVPANSKATIRLPDAHIANVTESGQPLNTLESNLRGRQDGDSVVTEIGSGQYEFGYTL